jgi:L-threonylcarbamoyladenylate synthase
MKTIIKKVDKEEIEEAVIKKAAEILQSGGLVAFPTETVYGLGGDGLNPLASEKIYRAKGRPSDNPLIIHIGDFETLDRLITGKTEKMEKLIRSFWPGPLTVIFHKSSIVPLETTGGLETVAIRMPEHPVARKLIRDSGVCIAAPSANTSGRPSPTRAEHVIEDLRGKIDMIIDGGEVGIGLESTIVDMTGETPVILRPGYITREMLEKVMGKVDIDQAILKKTDMKNPPKAPGMKYRHYAPKGSLTIIRGEEDMVVKKIKELAEEKIELGYETGIIATEETKNQYTKGHVFSIGSRQDQGSIGQHLYSVLREFDKLGVQYIYSEAFSEENFGQAIMNRLTKAAGYNILTV